MKKNSLKKVLGVIAVILVIAGVVYALYCYFKPALEDDFEEDLDDAFGDEPHEEDDKASGNGSDFDEDEFEEE